VLSLTLHLEDNLKLLFLGLELISQSKKLLCRTDFSIMVIKAIDAVVSSSQVAASTQILDGTIL
jgi:hypothetical protein